MKRKVFFLVFLLSFFVYAKDYRYGIVKDERGYTEVKTSNGKVNARLKNNTLVYIEKSEGGWAKVSSKTEYYTGEKYIENVEGYIAEDKLSYEFGPVVYVSTDVACDNTTLEKLMLKKKMDYENFSVIGHYLENQVNRYEVNRYKDKGYEYTVKADPVLEYTSILRLNNGLEMKVSEDYDFYISELKYKKININDEKVPVLGQFVPDTSIGGINRIEILENKNHTYIRIPGEQEKDGCSIKNEDRVLIFKDNDLEFLFDIVYENITKVREFDKWRKVTEKE
jgi:hypothetical protein